MFMQEEKRKDGYSSLKHEPRISLISSSRSVECSQLSQATNGQKLPAGSVRNTVQQKILLESQFKVLEKDLDSLNNLCIAMESGKSSMMTFGQVNTYTKKTVLTMNGFNGASPNDDNWDIIIKILRALQKLVRILKSTAILLNKIYPNPYLVMIAADLTVIDAILTIIISTYDIINGNGDLFDAIIELISAFAEFLPLTGANNAEETKRVVRKGCTAILTFHRAIEPLKDDPNVIDIAKKLYEINSFRSSTNDFVKEVDSSCVIL